MNSRDAKREARKSMEFIAANYHNPGIGPHGGLGYAWASLRAISGAGDIVAPWDVPKPAPSPATAESRR